MNSYLEIHLILNDYSKTFLAYYFIIYLFFKHLYIKKKNFDINM